MISPAGQDPSWFEDPARLFEEQFDIEPVQCLRNCDQVNRCCVERGCFCRCYEEVDTILRFCRGDLLGTCIRRYNSCEIIGQRPGSLPVSRCAIPGQIVRRRERRKALEKVFGISGTKRGVTARVSGKVVFEVTQRTQFGLRPSALAWL